MTFTKKVFILGVNGKPASGKSEILNVLEDSGWFCINCDKITRDLYLPGKIGQRRISDFFGEKYLKKNGEVNRAKLRKVVFNDPKKLKILNNLIHPLVISEIKSIIGKHEGKPEIAIEAIDFNEKFFKGLVGKIILVERAESSIVKVLKIDRKLSQKVVEGLLTAWQKPFRVDAVIKNDSTLKALKKKVIIALDKLTKS